MLKTKNVPALLVSTKAIYFQDFFWERIRINIYIYTHIICFQEFLLKTLERETFNWRNHCNPGVRKLQLPSVRKECLRHGRDGRDRARRHRRFLRTPRRWSLRTLGRWSFASSGKRLIANTRKVFFVNNRKMLCARTQFGYCTNIYNILIYTTKHVYTNSVA